MVAMLVLPLSGAPGLASGDGEQALQALHEKKVLALSDIVPPVLKKLDARLLDAEFETRRGGYFYELRLLASDGRIVEIMVDAATGGILEVDHETWHGERN